MEWIATQWQPLAQVKTRGDSLYHTYTIDLMVSPFYPGERFAVRRAGVVLADDGEWEFEPTPSSRDDAFYERCRFKSFDVAKTAAEKAIARAAAKQANREASK